MLENKQLSKRVLSDYAGLENSEPSVLKALRDFSFHIAAGNTDEAYRCVEGIQSRNVWENLAKMSAYPGAPPLALLDLRIR